MSDMQEFLLADVMIVMIHLLILILFITLYLVPNGFSCDRTVVISISYGISSRAFT